MKYTVEVGMNLLKKNEMNIREWSMKFQRMKSWLYRERTNRILKNESNKELENEGLKD